MIPPSTPGPRSKADRPWDEAAWRAAAAVVRPTTWTTYRIYAEAQVVPALGHIPLQWSAEGLRAFLAATSEDRLAAMWLLFATTGMRRGELLGLPWRAVNLEAPPGRLAVVQTVVVADKRPVVVAEAKTATSHRQIALDPFTVAALKAHRARQLEEWS